jgi:putative transcriptional regulator
MTRKNKIIEGLQDIVQFHAGDTSRVTVRTIHVAQALDVEGIRKRQGLTQEAFAKRYGFALSTLRNWEQGRRAPTGAVRNYLRVIEMQPQAVEAALAETSA